MKHARLKQEIRWYGGKCPVKKDKLVSVRMRDGDLILNTPAAVFCLKRRADDRYKRDFWHVSGRRDDILAYSCVPQ